MAAYRITAPVPGPAYEPRELDGVLSVRQSERAGQA